MAIQPDAPQLNIRLEIIPEAQNLQNKALANEIGREIFAYLQQQGYHIESVYTGEMGGETTFLLWLFPLVATVGQVLVPAVANEAASRVVGKVVDVFEQILQKMKKSKHKTAPVTIEVQSPANEIKAHGPLADTLATIIPALEKLDQKNTEITITTITIKVSKS